MERGDAAREDGAREHGARGGRGGWRGIARGAPILLLASLLGCGGLAAPSGSDERGLLPARWTDAEGRSQEVPFSFEARNTTSGELFTTLGKGGEHFRGPYVLLQDSTKGHLVTEIYDGWSSPEWEDWEQEPDGDWIATAKSYGEFAHFYTGKVVASLTGSEGHVMRCRLSLPRPDLGLLGGGEGSCQTSDRSRIDLEFSEPDSPELR